MYLDGPDVEGTMALHHGPTPCSLARSSISLSLDSLECTVSLLYLIIKLT